MKVLIGDIKLVSDGEGVTIIQKGESWGDPWPAQDSSVYVKDIAALIAGLKEIQSEKYSHW